MTISKIFLISMFVFALAACAPTPQEIAKAEKTRLEAQAQANAAEQARQQKQAKFDLEHAEAQARSAQWVASVTVFIRWVMIFSTIAGCVAVLGMGIGTGWGAVGIGKAVARVADLKARLIYMDVKTRSFPVIEYAGKGFLKFTDMNSGVQRLADSRTLSAPDRQLIAGAIRIRAIGMHAYEARKSTDPTGVAMVPQPLDTDYLEQQPDGSFIQVGTAAKNALIQVEVNDDERV